LGSEGAVEAAINYTLFEQGFELNLDVRT